jgi:hypothetical protein
MVAFLTQLDIMARFHAGNYCSVFTTIGQNIQAAKGCAPRSRIPDDWVMTARALVIHPASMLARDLEMQESTDLIGRILKGWETPVSCEKFMCDLDNLKAQLENEMCKRICFGIPAALSVYVNKDKPCGDAMYDAFPSTRFDLKEAGNCLGCGLNTASGFHLMRAVEVGLWELCKDRQTPLAQHKKAEFMEWGRLISELEEEIKKITNWPNSATKEEAHKFYNTALVGVRAFNDGWRRHIAHVRLCQSPMADDEALALWGHVSRFLSILSTKISEGKHTTLVWS